MPTTQDGGGEAPQILPLDAQLWTHTHKDWRESCRWGSQEGNRMAVGGAGLGGGEGITGIYWNNKAWINSFNEDHCMLSARIHN